MKTACPHQLPTNPTTQCDNGMLSQRMCCCYSDVDVGFSDLLAWPDITACAWLGTQPRTATRCVAGLDNDCPYESKGRTYHGTDAHSDLSVWVPSVDVLLIHGRAFVQAVSTGPQRSSILLSVAGADALVCLVRANARSHTARAGSLAYAILLSGIGNQVGWLISGVCLG